MKKILSMLLLCAFMSSCTSSTRYGDCIGLDDDKDPLLNYDVSIWNVFLAIIFSETIIVPVWVLLDEVECPVGYKAPPPKTPEGT